MLRNSEGYKVLPFNEEKQQGQPLPEQGNKQFGVLHSTAGPEETVVPKPSEPFPTWT